MCSVSLMIEMGSLLMFMVADRICSSPLVILQGSGTCGCISVLHHLEFGVIDCISSHCRIAGICEMLSDVMDISAFCSINQLSMLPPNSFLASPFVYRSFYLCTASPLHILFTCKVMSILLFLMYPV